MRTSLYIISMCIYLYIHRGCTDRETETDREGQRDRDDQRDGYCPRQRQRDRERHGDRLTQRRAWPDAWKETGGATGDGR